MATLDQAFGERRPRIQYANGDSFPIEIDSIEYAEDGNISVSMSRAPEAPLGEYGINFYSNSTNEKEATMAKPTVTIEDLVTLFPQLELSLGDDHKVISEKFARAAEHMRGQDAADEIIGAFDGISSFDGDVIFTSDEPA